MRCRNLGSSCRSGLALDGYPQSIVIVFLAPVRGKTEMTGPSSENDESGVVTFPVYTTSSSMQNSYGDDSPVRSCVSLAIPEFVNSYVCVFQSTETISSSLSTTLPSVERIEMSPGLYVPR